MNIFSKIKQRLLILIGILLIIMSCTLHWVFIIPSMVSFAIGHEANEFDFNNENTNNE